MTLERGLRSVWRAVLVCGCIAIGCGDDDTGNEAERLDVTVSLPNVAFSWEGPNITALRVENCAGGCTGLSCVDGEYLRPNTDCSSSECSPGTSWSVDYESGKELTSPVTYGMLGSEPDPTAQPLMAGVLHGVQLRRFGPCDPPEEGCGKIVAQGCAMFTP